MDVEAGAELVAEHAVVALLGVTFALAVVTALLWRVVRAFSPRLLSLVRALSSRVPAAERYLSLYGVLSFLVALAALGAFFAIADELELDDDLARFDVALSAALGRELGERTLRTFAAVTRLGDTRVLVALVIAVAVLLTSRRERLLAWSLVVTAAGGMLLNSMLKQIFGRARPVREHVVATADGLSFPSGHAGGAMVVYGFLCYVLVKHVQARWRLPLVLAWLLLAVAVGSSRVLLQVHYFSDVLAGWAIAMCWLALCVGGLESLRKWRSVLE